MIAGIVAVAAAAHDPERGSHAALTRRQDRAHQQRLGFMPSPVLEQRCEGKENGYNGIRQGKDGWAFLWEIGPAQLTPFS